MEVYMKNELFIEDLVELTGLTKRQIYNLLRRRDFYKKFRIKKMADLPNGTNNGSVSKILSEEQVKFLLDKIEEGCDFRSSDFDDDSSAVYVVELCPGGLLEIDGEKQRRFKIGFTSKHVSKRECDFKVTNPEAKVVRHWKMGSAEERVLLKYINSKGCSRIGNTEVFNVTDEEEFLRELDLFAENLK
jgi:hypothetical protein